VRTGNAPDGMDATAGDGQRPLTYREYGNWKWVFIAVLLMMALIWPEDFR